MPGTFPGVAGQSPVRDDADSSGYVLDYPTAKKIRESGGPTDLGVGAIADGQLLRRSGSSIVGEPMPAAQTFLGGHLWGLTLANNGTDATNDIDVAIGEAVSDEAAASSRVLMSLTTGLTKQLDVTWAAGTNAGGRVSGQTLADGTWHVFLFRRSAGGIDVCLSNVLSFTTPDSGTNRRRIGSILRASAAIVAFVQDGELFQRKAVVLDVDATNPGTAAVLRALSIPADLNVIALLNIIAHMATSGQGATLYISDPAVNDQAAARAVAPLGSIQIASTSEGFGGGPYQVRTNTSRQVRSRLSHSGASDVIRIATLGWIDRRGRDA